MFTIMFTAEKSRLKAKETGRCTQSTYLQTIKLTLWIYGSWPAAVKSQGSTAIYVSIIYKIIKGVRERLGVVHTVFHKYLFIFT